MLQASHFLSRRGSSPASVSAAPSAEGSRPSSQAGAPRVDHRSELPLSIDWHEPYETLDDDLPRGVQIFIVGLMFALVFLILGYSLAVLVQSLRIV